MAETSKRGDRLILSVPLPPSLNNAYTTGKDGKRHLSTQAREYKQEVRWLMLADGSRAKCPEPPFSFYVHLRLPDKRRRDASNAVKILEDAIFGVLEHDDSLVLDLHVFKYIDRKNPGVTVEIRHTDRKLEAAA